MRLVAWQYYKAKKNIRFTVFLYLKPQGQWMFATKTFPNQQEREKKNKQTIHIIHSTTKESSSPDFLLFPAHLYIFSQEKTRPVSPTLIHGAASPIH